MFAIPEQTTIQPAETAETAETITTKIDLLSRNKDLADTLDTIAEYYVMTRDKFRAMAFSNAAAKIAEHPIGITSGAQARRELTGIRDSIQSAIDEYMATYDEDKKTGTIKRLQELEARFDYPGRKDIITLFRSIYGIGSVSAVKFYSQGLRTLQDLWERGNLNEAQKLGIIWRLHINLRIPRTEMDLINRTIGSILNPYGIKWVIAGSYRRKEQSSGDIDILIESLPDLNMHGVIHLLKSYLPATFAQGPTKFMGMFRLDEHYNAHRIDIRLIKASQYGYSLMYFTGSQRFNILMRQRAIELGLTLNEYGLFDQNGRLYPAESEEEIFNLLKVRYIPPIERIKTINALQFM